MNGGDSYESPHCVETACILRDNKFPGVLTRIIYSCKGLVKDRATDFEHIHSLWKFILFFYPRKNTIDGYWLRRTILDMETAHNVSDDRRPKFASGGPCEYLIRPLRKHLSSQR